jgi:hypothetical protein
LVETKSFEAAFGGGDLAVIKQMRDSTTDLRNVARLVLTRARMILARNAWIKIHKTKEFNSKAASMRTCGDGQTNTLGHCPNKIKDLYHRGWWPLIHVMPEPFNILCSKPLSAAEKQRMKVARKATEEALEDAKLLKNKLLKTKLLKNIANDNDREDVRQLAHDEFVAREAVRRYKEEKRKKREEQKHREQKHREEKHREQKHREEKHKKKKKKKRELASEDSC